MILNGHELIVILGTLIGSGLAVNLVAQLLKKLFGLKTDSVIHTMVVTISLIAGFGQYSLQIKSQLPPEVLGISATTIYGFSQLFFKYARWAQDFMVKVNAYNAGQKAAKASNAAVAAVRAPSEAALAEPSRAPAEFQG